MLSLVMACRLLREFRHAFTLLDTPPFSIRHHPESVKAPTAGKTIKVLCRTIGELIFDEASCSDGIDPLDAGQFSRCTSRLRQPAEIASSIGDMLLDD